MAKVRIEMNRAGMAELLKGPEMAAACEDAARTIQARLGEDYELSTFVGRGRVNVSVYTTNEKAIQDNLDNNTMLKALG